MLPALVVLDILQLETRAHVKVYLVGRFPTGLKLFREMKSGIRKERNQGSLARSARIRLTDFDGENVSHIQHSSTREYLFP